MTSSYGIYMLDNVNNNTFYRNSIASLTGGIVILATIILPLIIQEKKLLKRAEKIASLLKQEFKKQATQLIAQRFEWFIKKIFE